MIAIFGGIFAILFLSAYLLCRHMKKERIVTGKRRNGQNSNRVQEAGYEHPANGEE
jgi:hypothetical protein